MLALTASTDRATNTQVVVNACRPFGPSALVARQNSLVFGADTTLSERFTTLKARSTRPTGPGSEMVGRASLQLRLTTQMVERAFAECLLSSDFRPRPPLPCAPMTPDAGHVGGHALRAAPARASTRPPGPVLAR